MVWGAQSFQKGEGDFGGGGGGGESINPGGIFPAEYKIRSGGEGNRKSHGKREIWIFCDKKETHANGPWPSGSTIRGSSKGRTQKKNDKR